MYVEMIDETGQVSEEIKKQTLELLDFAAQKLGKKDKEMAVTFVTNERSHELNLEYRDTDRPTDVISLEYKPELDITFDEEDLAENPELAERWGNLIVISANSLFLLIRLANKLRNMGIATSVRWAFWLFTDFFISTGMIITPQKKKRKCLDYRKKF